MNKNFIYLFEICNEYWIVYENGKENGSEILGANFGIAFSDIQKCKDTY